MLLSQVGSTIIFSCVRNRSVEFYNKTNTTFNDNYKHFQEIRKKRQKKNVLNKKIKPVMSSATRI